MNSSPALQPRHWLEAYPVLTEALAAQDEDLTPADAADLLSGIAAGEVPPSSNLHYVERCAFALYVEEYIAPDPVPASS